MRCEIRLAGTGGQGVILAGLVLAEAGILEGLNVVHTQNYGPEARGGTSISDVILSDIEIDYPKTRWLDVLIALDQKACDKNLSSLKQEGLVIVDSDTVDKIFWKKVIRVPISRKARDKFKDPRVANMLALGALVPFCSCVSRRSLGAALKKTMPAGMVQTNYLAFQEGVRLSRQIQSLKFEEIEGIIEV